MNIRLVVTMMSIVLATPFMEATRRKYSLRPAQGREAQKQITALMRYERKGSITFEQLVQLTALEKQKGTTPRKKQSPIIVEPRYVFTQPAGRK